MQQQSYILEVKPHIYMNIVFCSSKVYTHLTIHKQHSIISEPCVTKVWVFRYKTPSKVINRNTLSGKYSWELLHLGVMWFHLQTTKANFLCCWGMKLRFFLMRKVNASADNMTSSCINSKDFSFLGCRIFGDRFFVQSWNWWIFKFLSTLY